MKIVLVKLLVMAVFAVPAFSQSSLRGIVKDATDGTILPGANVVIENTYRGVHTGSDGAFVIHGLPGEHYSLVISYMGYQQKKVEVVLPQSTPVEVMLERTAVMTQEVIVKATRADSRTPSTKTDVSREFIRSVNLGQDIPYLLSMTPSFVTSSDAGAGVGYTSMNIRGSDQTRINVTINGIPVNDSESHGVFWVNMPDFATSTDNIQIQRGVGTSTQGAAAFGATISLETSRLQEDPYAEVFSSAGSFNTFRNSLNLGTGLLDNGFAFDGRLSKISSDGYIERASSDLSSYYLSGGYYSNGLSLKAIVFSGREKTYQAWNGVPGNVLDTNRRYNPSGLFFDANGDRQYYDNETDNYQQDHYQLHSSLRLTQSLVANISLHYTYGRGYYEQYKQRQRFSSLGLPNPVIENRTFDRTDLIRQRWLDNHFYGFTWSMNDNSFNKLNLIAGGGFNMYDGDHYGDIIWATLGVPKGHRYYENKAVKRDLNKFAKANYELFDRFFVFGDLQYRYIIYDFTGKGMVDNKVVPLDQQAVYHFMNPKAGFLYEVNSSNKLNAFFGISNREPVRRDFTESSPESRPKHETLQNLELGYQFTSSIFQGGINGYLMNYKNQLVLTGEINDVGGATRKNVDRSYRMGVELEAAMKPVEFLEVAGNVTVSRNKIPEFTEYSDAYDANRKWTGIHQSTYKNTDIAFSPSVVSAGRINYIFKNGSIGWFSKYVSSQYIDNTMSDNRKLDAYFVNDVKLSFLIKSDLFKELEFNLSFNNIFDRKYISNAWIYKGYVEETGLVTMDDGYFPQAGGHFLAGFRLRL
jgi:iron complex outermembrane recepter protein